MMFAVALVLLAVTTIMSRGLVIGDLPTLTVAINTSTKLPTRSRPGACAIRVRP